MAKTNKIKRSGMCQRYDMDGLKMVDEKYFVPALKSVGLDVRYMYVTVGKLPNSTSNVPVDPLYNALRERERKEEEEEKKKGGGGGGEN